MAYALLRDVTPQRQQWTIKGRITRFSQFLSIDQPPKVLTLDFVVLDEEETAMDAQIPTNCLSKFTPLLKEDSVYTISNFFVAAPRNRFRPVRHPYLMKFTSYTKVNEIKPIPKRFPKYACAITSFKDLGARVDQKEYCSDIIGIFRGSTPVRMQSTARGSSIALRNIQLSDESQQIDIALWGRQAELFDAESYIKMAEQDPVILLFVAVTCGLFNGNLSLQGSSFCRWYCNPDLPEVAALRNSCVGPLSPPTLYGAGSSQAAAEKITVTELAAIDDPHPIYTKKYIVNIKIKSIVPNQSWYYYACKSCNKGIKRDTDDIKCTKPGCSSTSAHNRYLLPLIATDPAQAPEQDEQPTIELVLFGSIAQELIGQPVDNLIASNAGVGTFLPKRITALYGKEYEVRLSVSPMSMRQDKITYQVDRIIGVLNSAPLQIPPAEHHPQQRQVETGPSPITSPSTKSAIVPNPVPAVSCALTTASSVPAIAATDPQAPIPDLSYTPPPKMLTPMEQPLAAAGANTKRSADNIQETTPVSTQSCVHPEKKRRVKRNLDLSEGNDDD